MSTDKLTSFFIFYSLMESRIYLYLLTSNELKFLIDKYLVFIFFCHKASMTYIKNPEVEN